MGYLAMPRMLRILLVVDLVAQPLQGAYAPESMGSAIPTRAISMGGGINLPKNVISMDFQEADVRDVLQVLAVKSGLNIISGSDVTGPVTVHLDRVPFDQAFQTVLTLKGLVALPMGSRIVRIVSSTGLTAEQAQAATYTRVFTLRYANSQDLKVPLDAIRTAAGRKGVSTVDAKTNSIVLTDTLEGLKQAEDLIPALDRKPQQVDIEAKVVEVSLDKDTQYGISWGFAKGQTGDQNFYGRSTNVTGTSGPGAAASASGNFTIPNPIGPVGAGTINSSGGGAGVNFPPADAFKSIAFTFLHAESAYLLQTQLAALASKNRVKILSTPHVVTLNNVEANINVVSQIPYQVSTLSNGVSQTSVQFVEAGVKLTVRPTINADRRITLKVKPEVSDASAASPAFQGAPPAINTRNAETTVLLRDGETIAIGGLIKESKTKSVSGIPLLMSIPILGYLFKTTEDRLVRTELIVFLTPKIAVE